MRFYECAECGDVKIGRDWEYCSNPCDDVAMVEVMSWGSGGLSEVAKERLAVQIKVKNDALKSGV